MKLCEIMIREVGTIAESEPAERAWQTMVRREVEHLAVIDRSRRVTGVISAHTLAGEAGARRRRGSAVEDLMTVSTVTASPQTTLREATEKLRGNAFGGYLPVLDGEELVGLVTVSDLHEAIRRAAAAAPARSRRSSVRPRRPPRRG